MLGPTYIHMIRISKDGKASSNKVKLVRTTKTDVVVEGATCSYTINKNLIDVVQLDCEGYDIVSRSSRSSYHAYWMVSDHIEKIKNEWDQKRIELRKVAEALESQQV